MLCNIYKDSFDNKSVHFVDVMKVLDGIKNGKWKEKIETLREAKTKAQRDELKRYLPCVTFSGTFDQKPSYVKKKGIYEMISKRDENLKDYSGLIVIDIDKLSDKERIRIAKTYPDDDFLFCAFESPSKGIKMLYEVDAESKYHKTASFEQVKQHVELIYGVNVDPSGKNISRLCYVSYDPDMYVNTNYVCFPVDVEGYEESVKVKVERNYDLINQDNVSYDLNYIWDVIKKWMDNKGCYYVVGNRNEYIHKIAHCLNRAGVTEEQIVNLILSNHSINKDMYNEVKTAVRSACDRGRNEFGSKPIIDNRKRKIQRLL